MARVVQNEATRRLRELAQAQRHALVVVRPSAKISCDGGERAVIRGEIGRDRRDLTVILLASEPL